MGPQGDPGFVTILMGAVMLVIAAVGSPLTLIKAIPFVESQVVGHWSGQMRRGVISAAAIRRLDPKRLQAGPKGPAGRVTLPVKSSQGQSGQPRIMVLPRGAQLFVRTPRPAQAAGSGGGKAAGPVPASAGRRPWPQPQGPAGGQPWGAPRPGPQQPPRAGRRP